MCTEFNIAGNLNRPSAYYNKERTHTSESIIQKHDMLHESYRILNLAKEPELPTIYGLPKLQHHVIPLLRVWTSLCLAAVYQFTKLYCKGIHGYTGYNRKWILENLVQLKEHLSHINEQSRTFIHVSTWDFMYLIYHNFSRQA